ncbi:hypothetical protein [Ferrimonas balearica]|uniref:hypothetical protein n=1 Tax=Ferrimonas balearica TaxID=44012 RepID=UPI001C99A31F|nr:hypothetical protein [Ferrimonas balearica]MBY5992184.1 hypothetical protein [Ferrimonas balearica]
MTISPLPQDPLTLCLDRALVEHGCAQPGLYREFVPLFMHYYGQMHQAVALEGEVGRAVRDFNAMALAFADVVEDQHLPLERELLAEFGIELGFDRRDPGRREALTGSLCYQNCYDRLTAAVLPLAQMRDSVRGARLGH